MKDHSSHLDSSRKTKYVKCKPLVFNFCTLQYLISKLNHLLTLNLQYCSLLHNFIDNIYSCVEHIFTYFTRLQVNLSVHDLTPGHRKGYFGSGKSGLQIVQVVRRQLLLGLFYSPTKFYSLSLHIFRIYI